jgi:hypothetical protein
MEAEQAFDGVMASLKGVRVADMIVPVFSRNMIKGDKIYKLATSTVFELAMKKMSFVRVAAIEGPSEMDDGISVLRALQSTMLLDVYDAWQRKIREILSVAAKLDVGAGMSLIEPKDAKELGVEVFMLKSV